MAPPSLTSPSPPWTAAFDPEAFRRLGHGLIDRLADYLGRAEQGGMPVLPPSDPAVVAERWPARFDAPTDFFALLGRVLAESNHLHHPRYIGHQVTAPLPLAALCDLVAALLNNGMAVYEMGPVSTAMEHNLVGWMARKLGFSGEADGIFTSGGSIGNLTALLAARQAKAGFDVWGRGAAGGPPLALLCSDQSHYSVLRAAQIMGLGQASVVPVPSDAAFRMRPDALPGALAQAQRLGRKPIAVVASAGSTATGAFDPLGAIADFCTSHDLWLHVDGAHGACAALSPKTLPLLAGIERADSVVWDPHKMMLMPALVSLVLFREGHRSYEAFSQEASYLFEAQWARERPWFESGLRTLECTKRMMSLKVYLALAVYGERFFAEYVEATFALAHRFAARLAHEPDFELACMPECNIVCFRHLPAGAGGPVGVDLDAHQAALRERLLASGAFYVVQTRLPAGLFLRTTLINPLTSEDDLDDLVEMLRVPLQNAR